MNKNTFSELDNLNSRLSSLERWASFLYQARLFDQHYEIEREATVIRKKIEKLTFELSHGYSPNALSEPAT